jgi:hypothetical protein
MRADVMKSVMLTSVFELLSETPLNNINVAALNISEMT